MKIGILQAGHVPDEVKAISGDYTAMYTRLLDGHDFTFQTWSVVDMEFPNSVDDAVGWLISGSKHGAYEEHAFIAPLEAFVREIAASDHPMVGVCFGHQIIAKALGGTVEKFDGGWAVGHNSYDINGESLLLNAWHQDQVTQLPETAKRIGTSDFCENAMLHYAGKALTIQPHPEFDGATIDCLLDVRAKGVVPDDLQGTARARLKEPDSNLNMGATLAHFLKTKSLPS